ncbi:MAG TPA: ribonuclease H-like domain-containing protein [Candidatus Eisenbacteria bacterium]|jgi:hypothetical protein
MLDNDLLRARLGELVRGRRAAPVPGEEPAPGAAEPAPGSGDEPASALRRPSRPREQGVGVEEYLPGGEWRGEHGAVFVHERLRSAIEKPRAHWGRLGEAPEEEPELRALAAAGLSRALFLDLETGGLASSPVFLAGTMHWNGEDFVLRQYFARHYGEEAALLAAVGAAARGFEFLVTFNGKSYDAPFLAGRAVVHGLEISLPPRHLDLLHAARRRWKERLADCRLTTLELHVCRRRRSGDVPGEEVPGLYHDFVRSGDPYRLIPVFHHNLLDVITMAEVLHALCATKGLETPERVEI